MKKCRNPECKQPFKPTFNNMQPTCSVPCAIRLGQIAKAKTAVRVEKARVRENRQAKRDQRENDLAWWLKVDAAEGNKNGGNTAYWLHRWIRLVRDKDQPCPMCGSMTPKGGHWHACHYRSRGAAKHLRFTPDNIHKGCQNCNTRTSGDTGAKFRADLVLRLGEDRVTEIDNDNTIYRWTIDECREIRNKYKTLVKEAGV